jgi:hypothetical protein
MRAVGRITTRARITKRKMGPSYNRVLKNQELLDAESQR